MTTTPGMSPSPTHDGVYGGQYRVVEWVPTDGGGFKARMTGVLGVSKATAEAESTRLAATTGGVYMAHPAGPLKPPGAPKVARQPKPKDVVRGRNRADLKGLTPPQVAEALYGSTEVRYTWHGALKLASPRSGRLYTIDAAGNCNCDAWCKCWHLFCCELKARRGDILPMEEGTDESC